MSSYEVFRLQRVNSLILSIKSNVAIVKKSFQYGHISKFDYVQRVDQFTFDLYQLDLERKYLKEKCKLIGGFQSESI